MKRTPIVRKAPMARTPKPAKGPRPKSCRVCRSKFVPAQPMAVACGVPCAIEYGRKKTAEQKAKQQRQERAQDRKQKRESMTTAQLAEPVRKLAQRYAVVRDWHYGCISCDKGPHAFGVVWQGSHFKSVGSNSTLQFNLWNIHKACDQCNYFKAGNIAPYETRLRQKIGDAKVDWLKCHPRSREYSIEYLDRLTSILRKKIRRQEKRLGIK